MKRVYIRESDSVLITVSKDDLDIIKDLFCILDIEEAVSSAVMQWCNHEINRLDEVSCDTIEYRVEL